ncbi:hypothetical protein W97_05121 [Coniosporium apollinis CBS 100218]|uniref:Origin recognition complex subunit 2 n=1 Tax=Coniosporium apollinis (strain CBS 100218) TaxID=1168221 RepID=R7YVN8_CONA1|nr:uncharacterized protein W97_05121 [Coniosporium apollinis CBS 100218]EON65879.1 hypothetical protein W97_05121 [Coniosporium apollinis CBS 100218]
MKRKRAEKDAAASTPTKKTRADIPGDDLEDEIAVAATTPSKRTPSKPSLIRDLHQARTNGATNGFTNGDLTPRTQRKVLFSTPTKQREDEPVDGTPTNARNPIIRNADRSARRKSAGRLIERTISGDQSDEDVDEEDTLARQIWDEDEEEAEEDILGEVDEEAIPETPSKRGRGRPKGRQRKRSPTPPTNLPPHELYFYQNRPGGTKTSNNTLPSHSLLNHEEYFVQLQSYKDPHADCLDFLHSVHTRSFNQWSFELRNNFNICLYGYGSKRQLVQDFASHLHSTLSDPPTTIIVNGYIPTITPRDILTTIATALLPKNAKLPAQPPALLQLILSTLTSEPPSQPLLLIINSLDAPSLRRQSTQSLLAQLAAHPSISLLATTDTPTFPLLWDLSLRQQFRFLFHDCTTFVSFSGVEIDVVESVNELLGRSGRRIGGRDGVGYVLRSLPENARGVFRILVGEQLAAAAADEGLGDEEGEMSPQTERRVGKAGKQREAAAEQGVEYRVLYHKAVEEFLCSSEMVFRTLLKEFHDHQMVESRKDALGTETLWVPFRREELEGLLEELIV